MPELKNLRRRKTYFGSELQRFQTILDWLFLCLWGGNTSWWNRIVEETIHLIAARRRREKMAPGFQNPFQDRSLWLNLLLLNSTSKRCHDLLLLLWTGDQDFQSWVCTGHSSKPQHSWHCKWKWAFVFSPVFKGWGSLDSVICWFLTCIYCISTFVFFGTVSYCFFLVLILFYSLCQDILEKSYAVLSNLYFKKLTTFLHNLSLSGKFFSSLHYIEDKTFNI